MNTTFLYDETIKIKGGEITAKIEVKYGESGKALPIEEYDALVKAAKDAKRVIKKIAKEHKQ